MTLGQVAIAGAIMLVLSSVFVPVIRSIDYASGPGYKANCKQVATAMLLYAEANSGRFPFAYSYDTSVTTWRWNASVSIPAGWRPSLTPQRAAEDNLAWANSTRPYYHDPNILGFHGFALTRTGTLTDYDNPLTPYYNSSLNYNGLLHSYPVSSVTDPTQLPLIWSGEGRAQLEGASLSSPAMNCRPSSPCTYPNNTTTGALFYPPASLWVMGRTSVFVSVDASIKLVPMGAVNDTSNPSVNTDWRTDPFTGYDAQGKPGFFWWDGRYPWLFRPDYDFRS